MSVTMKEMKQTATEHMWRDMKTAGKWVCMCEPCREIRALMGMDKLLGVWPLVRQLQDAGGQLDDLPDGPEKQLARQQYLTLFDRLAEQMAS
jgi:hypothetical protein